jgi:hypothetical protein
VFRRASINCPRDNFLAGPSGTSARQFESFHPSPMKPLALIIGCLILAGCSKLGAVSDQCLSIAWDVPNHHNARSVDFWNEYKKCFGTISYGTGCLLLKGDPVPEECFPSSDLSETPESTEDHVFFSNDVPRIEIDHSDCYQTTIQCVTKQGWPDCPHDKMIFTQTKMDNCPTRP